jgi:hypothetical protein
MIFAAIAVIALLVLASGTLTKVDIPEQVVSIDAGNENRANQLIGTIGTLVVNDLDLIALEGFHPWRDKYDSLIYLAVDRQFRLLDPVMVKAIMSQESSFNPDAIRHEAEIADDSIGLMQLLTETARWIAPFRDLSQQQIKERLLDPVTNVSVGCKYLTWQIGRYGRSTREQQDKVIAAYNAGSAKYGAGGTLINHSYVASVRGRMEVYQYDFPPLRTS